MHKDKYGTLLRYRKICPIAEQVSHEWEIQGDEVGFFILLLYEMRLNLHKNGWDSVALKGETEGEFCDKMQDIKKYQLNWLNIIMFLMHILC